MALAGTHFEVSPPLSDIVKHFYVMQSGRDFVTTTAHLSPNYEMMWLFNFGAPVRFSFAAAPLDDRQIDKVAVLGPLRKMLNYELLPETDLLAVVFNLDGFYRLFQVPVDALNDEQLHHPGDFMEQASAHELWEVLKRTPSSAERVEILKDYISTAAHAAEEGALPLLNGADYFNDQLIQPAKAIAADADLSERTVQMRFKKYVGYSPKEMLRFLRFKQVISSIEHNTADSIDWFDLIHDFGYHDQSHLIKDFQYYLGTTPETFIKQIARKEFCTTKPGKRY
ncbi:helix-turn-helix domain-containing protein [Chitinophaga sp. RCC_12]|uniref:AraC family transcriptional regulator n=1 Tax=Chitinophaga sp. RCC_12 TaxID=3239226 RepID=UPI003525F26F